MKRKIEQKNEELLIQWLRNAEQIPEKRESVNEFIERTGWTLKNENEWRKISGLRPLKSKREYHKLFEEQSKC